MSGGWIAPKSTADGPAFFLSPQGKTDPLAELEATLLSFRTGESEKIKGGIPQSPYCAFPARRQYLERVLQEEFPAQSCSDYDAWLAGLAPHKLTFVFSSAYPNNPAAMFGHTFLRVDRRHQEGRARLMGYGVAFSANIPPEIDSFRYGLYGLFGGFAGLFSLAPYYTMVNDYTSAEIRDLWEYPLLLNEAQVAKVIEHLWELYSTTYFDYYFLSENCTTQLLALLQVAMPEKDLLKDLPWYTLPIESIHHLREIGLLGEPGFRPSVKKQLTALVAALTDEERSRFSRLVSGERKPQEESEARVLEAAAAYWNYRKFLKGRLVDSPEQAELLGVLTRRASLGKKEPLPLSYDQSSRPDLGHFTTLAGLGWSYRENENRIQAHYRLGLHDLLNRSTGYEPNSSIELLSGRLSYGLQSKRLRLNELKLIEIVSLFPWDRFDKKLSWTVSARFEESLKENCGGCGRALLEGGGGVAGSIFGRELFYVLGMGRAAYRDRQVPEPWDLGLGVNSGMLLRFSPSYAVDLGLRGEWDFFRSYDRSWDWSLRLSQAYSFSRRWEARFEADLRQRNAGAEGGAGARISYFY